MENWCMSSMDDGWLSGEVIMSYDEWWVVMCDCWWNVYGITEDGMYMDMRWDMNG